MDHGRNLGVDRWRGFQLFQSGNFAEKEPRNTGARGQGLPCRGEFFGGGGEAHIYTIVLTMRRVDIAKKEIPVPRTQDAIQPVGARHP